LAAGYIILLFGFEAILRILYPTPYKNIWIIFLDKLFAINFIF
jgi:hypothetical protein